MANNYFQFKEFKVTQQSAAMKVTTEGCLFGAWVAAYLKAKENKKPNPINCLDIGTGTGLLSLMVAQKNENVHIDAIEIVPATAAEAQQNVAASKWSGVIAVSTNDILVFRQYCMIKYEFIFSNPPFFENDLVSSNNNRNLAMHSASLNLEELLLTVEKLLAFDGIFALLLPSVRTKQFNEMAAKVGLNLHHQLSVKQSDKHPNFRTISIYGRDKPVPQLAEMEIKIGNQYSQAFVELLKDYYLYL